MGIIQHPAAPPHAPAIMAILDRFNRDELGHAIEVLIALLDIWDGDPDDKQTNDAEDDFAFSEIAERYADKGPGCIASDSPGDQAWIEWTAMRGSKKRGAMIMAGPEDAEEDDAAEEDDDVGQATEDEISYGRSTFGRTGAGCELSDPDAEHDGREPEDCF